jgi:hypothetical protein
VCRRLLYNFVVVFPQIYVNYCDHPEIW